MVDILENFNFESTDSATLAKMITSVTEFLCKAQEHYSKIAMDLSFKSSSSPLASTPKSTKKSSLIPSSPISDMTETHHAVLDTHTLKQLKEELNCLRYHETGPNRPEVCLFGDESYTYSKETKNLSSLPLMKSPIISQVLDTVNAKFGNRKGGFNSVLVNKYRTKNVSLGWHKDDEKEVDQSYPIISLSIGATRRFSITDSKDTSGRNHLFTEQLENNDVFVMRSGVQSAFYHRIEKGRSSASGECGVRYSLTFRRLLSTHPKPLPLATHTVNHKQTTRTNDHSLCSTTSVFGSSLVKGLRKDLLSQRSERVNIFCRPGAHVNDIIGIFDNAVKNKEVCTRCTNSIFLVVGGNQVENAKNSKQFDMFLNDYTYLLNRISEILPQVKIQVVSLIPRRAKDQFHNMKMIRANEELRSMCKMYTDCRFINIFSFYLTHKKEYFRNRVVCLNESLYSRDMLHFSSLGNSVLGKVIKGVIYDPLVI